MPVNPTRRLATFAAAIHIYAMRRPLPYDELTDTERPVPRCCDHPDCTAAGEHRAPKGRDRLNDFYWFCLDHVRAYNKAWNFYSGMNEDEIEAEIRRDTVWRRPTWPLGAGVKWMRDRDFRKARFRDGFSFFQQGDEAGSRAEDRSGRVPSPGSVEGKALRLLGLEAPVTLTQLKARYKELVKQLHPDLKGGDTTDEDRLKDINQAYATLRKTVTA